MFSSFSFALSSGTKVLGISTVLGASSPLTWIVLSSPNWYYLWRMNKDFKSVALDCSSNSGGAVDQFVLFF